ncbi:MAG: hypothetical protein ACYC1C_02170, partial [Chloroflexota bacterium]
GYTGNVESYVHDFEITGATIEEVTEASRLSAWDKSFYMAIVRGEITNRTKYDVDKIRLWFIGYAEDYSVMYTDSAELGKGMAPGETTTFEIRVMRSQFPWVKSWFHPPAPPYYHVSAEGVRVE